MKISNSAWTPSMCSWPRRLAALGLLAGIGLAAVGCGTPNAPTPLPATATAISVIQQNKTLPGPTSPPEQAGTIPVRIVGREVGVVNAVNNGLGTMVPVQTPEPAMHFKLEWTNNTEHDLAAFSGVLLFHDKGGQTIEGFSEKVAQPVKQGEKIITEFEMLNNPFMDSRKVMSIALNSELSVTFKPKFLTVAGGHQIELP